MEQVGDLFKGRYGWIECNVEFTADDVTALNDAIDMKIKHDGNIELLDKRLELLKSIVQEGTVNLTNQNIKDLHTAVVGRVHDLQRDSLEVSEVLSDLREELLEYRNDMNPS